MKYVLSIVSIGNIIGGGILALCGGKMDLNVLATSLVLLQLGFIGLYLAAKK